MSATNNTESKIAREVPTTYGKLNAAEKKLFCFYVHAVRNLKEKGIVSSDVDEFDIDTTLIYSFNANKNIFKEIDLEVKADLKEKKKNDDLRKKMEKLAEKEAEKEAKKEAKKNAKKEANETKKNTKKEPTPEVGPRGTLRSSEYDEEVQQETKPKAVKAPKAPKQKKTEVSEPVVAANEYKAIVRTKVCVEFRNTELPEDKYADFILSELPFDKNDECDIHELEVNMITHEVFEIVFKVKNDDEKKAIFEAEFLADIDPDGNCREIERSYRMGDVKYEPIVANQTEELIKAGMKKPRVTRNKKVVSEEPVVEVVEQVIADPAPEVTVTQELSEEKMIEDPVATAIVNAVQDEVPPKNVTIRKKYVRKPKATANTTA
jgi:hypothetical protein